MARSRTTELVSRSAEGALVPAKTTVVARPDGSTQVQLGIDLGAAPIPSRRYHADSADVLQRGEAVVVVFAQAKLYGSGLRSMVSIHLSADAVHQFLRTCHDFYPRIAQFVENNLSARSELGGFENEPEQSVSFVANLIAAAHAGREAILDFYHFSPTAVREIKGGSANKVSLDPVLRIDLSSALLYAVLERLMDLENHGELAREIQ